MKITVPLMIILVILIGVASVSSISGAASNIADGCHHAMEKVSDMGLDKDIDASNMLSNGKIVPVELPSDELMMSHNRG
jgi:hypothetical protein